VFPAVFPFFFSFFLVADVAQVGFFEGFFVIKFFESPD
jgi:hypothetical protein